MEEIPDQAGFLSIIWNKLPEGFKRVPPREPLESYKLVFLDELPDVVTHTEIMTKEEAKELYGDRFRDPEPGEGDQGKG